MKRIVISFLLTAVYSIRICRTPDELARQSFPESYEGLAVTKPGQVNQNKLENFKQVVATMNGVKMNRLERDMVAKAAAGSLASRLKNLKWTDDFLLGSDESADESTCAEETSNKGKDTGKKSFKERREEERKKWQEERKKREEERKKKDEERKETKRKREDEKKKAEEEAAVDPEEESCVPLDSLAEQITPRLLRKVIMAYIDHLKKLPEQSPKEKVDVGAVVAGLSCDQPVTFFQSLLHSLGQSSRKADKGVKVGHVLVTQMQVKAIRQKGITVLADIAPTTAPAFVVAELSEPGLASLASIQPVSAVPDPLRNIAEIEPVSAGGEVGLSEAQAGQAEARLASMSTSELRRLLLAFIKLTNSATTVEKVAVDCSLPVQATRHLLLAVTNKCRQSQTVEGKRVGFKIQNAFINSSWIEKIISFNFQ